MSAVSWVDRSRGFVIFFLQESGSCIWIHFTAAKVSGMCYPSPAAGKLSRGDIFVGVMFFVDIFCCCSAEIFLAAVADITHMKWLRGL